MDRLKRIALKVFKWGLLSGFVAFVIFTAWLIFWVKIFELPNFDSYLNYRPYQTTYFLDRNEEILGCIASEWRDPISAAEAKELLVAKVILAVEDRRFYERPWGIDAKAIARAFLKNLMAGHVVEGGSTLEQQLVKHLLRPEERTARSFGRKIKEAAMAFQLISRFNKDQILALYLNEVYLGGDRDGLIGQVYGIEASSRYYFNKRARDLTLSEAATLAGIIKAPASLSPKTNSKGALEKRNQALSRAYQEGGITKDDYGKALDETISVTNDFAKSCQHAPHAIWEARKILRKEYKLYFDAEELESVDAKEERTQLESAGQNYARLGLRVVMTLDGELQRFAEEGVRYTIQSYKERQTYNAIDAEASFLAIENGTGAVIAMVGGADFNRRKFNSATQARRQTGSAFKPIVYVTKFEEELALGKPYDMLLNETVSNAYISCKDKRDPKTGQWTYWTPRNFDEKKFGAGSYTRRFAIAQSINRPAVWTAQAGKCRLDPRILLMARRLGITSELDNHLPTALGASGISLLELVRAYSTFPNKGVLRETYMISKIYSSDGQNIFEKKEWKQGRVLSEVLAGVMVDALRGVVKFGTVRALDSVAQPSACKTGTTEGYIDVWLVCFTPHVTLGAWMGGPEDYKKSLGDRETGAKLAPAIKYVLEHWYAGFEPTLFQEESSEYMKFLVSPPSFEKEMDELKNSDPDTEAPQE